MSQICRSGNINFPPIILIMLRITFFVFIENEIDCKYRTAYILDRRQSEAALCKTRPSLTDHQFGHINQRERFFHRRPPILGWRESLMQTEIDD